MARLPRKYAESGMYFVTVRTVQARALLEPVTVKAVLGGVLAQAIALSGVELHGFVALSNHIHLLVTAKGSNLSGFMQYFLGNAARKVGRLVDWSGTFWQRPFSAQPVLDDEAAVSRLRYIISHGVKEGLVRSPEEWPGLSCVPYLLDEVQPPLPFFRWSLRWKNGQQVEGGANPWDDRWVEEVPLKLTPLPCWAALSVSARRQRTQSLLDDVTAEGLATHRTVVGLEAVVRASKGHRPLRGKKTRRPLCHASSAEVRKAYREGLNEWLASYSRASQRFRCRDWAAEFPPWSFRPPSRVGP